MARRRTVLTIPIPAGGVEMADVLAVLTGVGPSYDLTRIDVQSTIEGENFLVLTAGQRRLRPGVLIGADPLPGIEEDAAPIEEGEQPDLYRRFFGAPTDLAARTVRAAEDVPPLDGEDVTFAGVATNG